MNVPQISPAESFNLVRTVSSKIDEVGPSPHIVKDHLGDPREQWEGATLDLPAKRVIDGTEVSQLKLLRGSDPAGLVVVTYLASNLDIRDAGVINGHFVFPAEAPPLSYHPYTADRTRYEVEMETAEAVMLREDLAGSTAAK